MSRTPLSDRERCFCVLFARHGADEQAGIGAYREAYTRPKAPVKTVKQRVARLLGRPVVADEIARQKRIAANVIKRAQQDMLDIGFKVEKARQAAQYEAYLTLIVWSRSSRERLEKDQKVGTADAAALKTALQVTGDLGGANVTINLPEAVTAEITDIDAEIDKIRRQVAGKGKPPDAVPEPVQDPQEGGVA